MQSENSNMNKSQQDNKFSFYLEVFEQNEWIAHAAWDGLLFSQEKINNFLFFFY